MLENFHPVTNQRHDDARNYFVKRFLANQSKNDVAPSSVAFAIAASLFFVAFAFCGFHWIARKLNISVGAAFGETLDIWTPNGNPTTTVLVLVCMIPSFLVLGGIQYNFNTAMLVVTIFPIGLVIAGGIRTYTTYRELRKQYYRAKRKGDINGLAYFEACLRKIEVHSIFADPDEPLARVVLIGACQIMLLGMYVWGLWDRGRPNFSEPRLYAYYYAGMFMLVAYVAGKLGGDKEANLKGFAHQWRRSIELGGAITKREVVNRPAGLFNASTYWAFYFLGVEVHGDDFSWASEGEITMGTLVLRYLLNMVVNTAGLYYIMVGLPIQVSHNIGPVDFVLTAVAAFYIIEMDNTGSVRIVEIPNFDNEQRGIDGNNDIRTNEVVAILNELPQEKRLRLSDLLREGSN